MSELQCLECKKHPEDIREYRDALLDDGWEDCQIDDSDIQQFVIKNEGTYNPLTHKFWCTNCYTKLGMPLGKARPI